MSSKFDGLLLLVVAGTVLITSHRAADASEPLPCSFSGAQCSVEDVTNPKEIAARIADFQEQFRRVGISGRIERCDSLVEESIAKGTAFGAVCNIKFEGNTYSWVICADNYVGNFSADFGLIFRPKTRRDQIIDFTRDRCLGG